MMDCTETRARLQEEREALPLPAPARAHLDACAACRAFREALLAVDDALAKEPELAFPAALAERIRAGAARERRRGRLAGFAAAALVLVAAGVGLRLVAGALAGAGLPVGRGPGLPESAGAALRDLGAAAAALAGAVLDSLASVPVAGGPVAAVLGLVLLLLVNGLVVVRRAAADGRRS